MIKAIALDDEPLALKIVENFCSKVPFIELEKTFSKPSEALKHLQKFPADLLFLDIQMPSLTGIEFYRSVKQDTMVIFTTAHSEYAVESYNLSAIDYLLKPFTFERFEQAANKANEYYQYMHKQQAASSHLFIRADYSLIKITISDILYIEGLDDYLKIHIQNQKPVVARMTMKAMTEKLPASDFIRVHRSFIVPLNRVEQIRNKMITVAGHEVPIGGSYEEQVFTLLKR
jgi:DNA-binding LytR/AlgR family response regulator